MGSVSVSSGKLLPGRILVAAAALLAAVMFASGLEASTPQVHAVQPAAIAGVALDAPVSVTFNGAVTVPNPANSGILIRKDGIGDNLVNNNITVTVESADPVRHRINIPHGGFAPNSEYQVVIPAGAVNINGVPNQPIVYYFTTLANLTTLEPEVAFLGRNPAPNATGVARGIGTITVKFRYPIQFVGNEHYHNILVQDSLGSIVTANTGAAIAEIVNDNLGRATVLRIPIKELRPDMTYTVEIPLGSLIYQGGVHSHPVISWSFTTEKRPVPETFSFEPSGLAFKIGEFPLGPPNFTAGTFPSLANVERHGVGVNQTVVIAFNDDIVPGPIGLNLITISGSPSDPGINTVPSIEGNRLIIRLERANATFETNILRYGTIYTITIPAGTIGDARGGNLNNDLLRFRFETFHNFDSTIVQGSIVELNNIMRRHPPRNIAVVVPQKYLLEVQTIHHVRGLVPMPQGATNTQQNLTNIDIIAHADVHAIRIDTHRGFRMLSRNKNGIFTTGYAGLEADGLSEITMYALDRYGKLLEKKLMKLEVEGTNPLKVYNFRIAANLVGTHSLYNLMANSTLLNGILQHFPVSQLRNIGVYFPFDW
jgi:hypothetical protein